MLGSNIKNLWLSLSGVVSLGISFAAHAAPPPHTIFVGTCHSGSSPTIQAAVVGVASGGVVNVCPGTYPEQVTISQPLTLTGIVSNGGDAAIIVPPGGGIAANGVDIGGNQVAAQIFVQSVSGVTIKNMTVDGIGNNLNGCVSTTFEGIYFQNSTGTITHDVVRNQYQTNFASYGGCQNGLGINVESNSGSSNVSITANSVRAYQKNGITASGPLGGTAGPSVTVSNNFIVGLAATNMNWATPGAAENGIQISFGATGTVSLNTVNDNIWAPDTSSDTGDAASGILIYASSGIEVTSNKVNSAQFGIVAVSDPTYGVADSTIVKHNDVSGTQLFDAIDFCSNADTAQSNAIYGSAESGIHLDSSCGSTGNNATVTQNTIVEACAGILLGSGFGNTITPNTFDDVVNTTLAGDVCPAPTMTPAAKGAMVSKTQKRLRPSPYKP